MYVQKLLLSSYTKVKVVTLLSYNCPLLQKMAGRNCTGKQTRSEAVAPASHDKGILDELRAFWNHVPYTSPPTKVSNRKTLLARARQSDIITKQS